jgi:large subunit ribosomal protein L24
MRIKKGDTVVVVAGRDRGAVGKVIAAYPKQDKVLVEGVNRITKHTKIVQSARGAKSGGIVHQEAPIHVSSVMLAVEVDVEGGKKTVGTRVGFRVDDNGNKVRFAKRTGEDI